MVNFRLSELLGVAAAMLLVGAVAALSAGDSADLSSGLSIPGPEMAAVMVSALIGFGMVVAGRRDAAPVRRRRVNRARLRARRAAA